MDATVSGDLPGRTVVDHQGETRYNLLYLMNGQFNGSFARRAPWKRRVGFFREPPQG
jgi:hypothetical protein